MGLKHVPHNRCFSQKLLAGFVVLQVLEHLNGNLVTSVFPQPYLCTGEDAKHHNEYSIL